MKYPYKVPFIVENHPKSFTGYKQLSIVTFFDIVNKLRNLPVNKCNTTSKIVVCEDINTFSSPAKGEIIMLDVEKVDEEVGAFILKNWKEDMPLSMYCDIHGVGPNVKHAWFSVPMTHVKHWIGTLYYFDDKPIRVVRKRIKR